MSLAAWTLVMVVATGVCAFTLKSPQNPFKGFITSKLFFVHIALGLITIVVAIAAVINS